MRYDCFSEWMLLFTRRMANLIGGRPRRTTSSGADGDDTRAIKVDADGNKRPAARPVGLAFSLACPNRFEFEITNRHWRDPVPPKSR